MICCPFGIKHYRGDETKEDEMVWARGMHEGKEICIKFLVGKPAGEDGRIILKWAVKKQDGNRFMLAKIGTRGGLL